MISLYVFPVLSVVSKSWDGRPDGVSGTDGCMLRSNVFFSSCFFTALNGRPCCGVEMACKLGGCCPREDMAGEMAVEETSRAVWRAEGRKTGGTSMGLGCPWCRRED